MIQYKYITALLLLLPCSLSAQTAETIGAGTKGQTLLETFKKGTFGGNFRSFFMATDNASGLSDYFALATGGSLRFNSARFHGFSVGIGGSFNYKLAATDLSAKDSLTGAINRYEIGLFDVQNPGKGSDLNRLEEFWLRYQWKKLSLTLGHQFLQTPFINDQDGRMRPTTEAGFWAVSKSLKNVKIEGGWLWKISPRSTVQWFDIGKSIGLYPKGLNPDGTGSGYADNLKSKGVGLIGIHRQWGKRLSLQVWDQYVENIFNSALAQADYKLALSQKDVLEFGLQLLQQNALAEGGHRDASRRYFPKKGKSAAISLQGAWQKGNWKTTLAYTRVGAQGRFLSPREWGREPFYTFMSRERVEGSGDSHSATARLSWQKPQSGLRLELAYGHFYLPDVKNAALNKYAFPAYNQLNVDLRYAFKGALDGLRTQLLFVYKGRLGETYNNPRYVINRVNMSQYNLIINYTY